MNRYFLGALACGMLAGLASTGGCVSLEEHNKLKAANRRAITAKDEALAKLRACRGQNEKLTAEVSSRDGIIRGKQEQIDNLLAARTDSLADLKKMEALLAKLRREQAKLVISPLPEALDKALKSFAKANPDLVEYVPRYGMVKFKADLTFAKGSVLVQPEAVAALTKLAEIVNTPVAQKFSVYVAGHTDDIPLRKAHTIREHKSNWGLSAHRALAVVKVLFEAGVDQPRMAAMGFSKYHPVAANRPGNRGNPANRRVEIWIVPPKRLLTSGGQADK